MKRVICLAVLALAGCGPKAEAPAATPSAPEASLEGVAPAPDTSSDALTARGWGPLTIGMTKEEVTQALGPDANPDAVGGPDPDTCDEYRPERGPDGLMVMILNGRLSRISLVEQSTIKTAKGFAIGAIPSDVKSAYGDAAQVTPHKYQGPPAEYITVWDGGPRAEPFVEDESARGIVYEVDGTGHVGAIHAGGPSIQYVEGCA